MVIETRLATSFLADHIRAAVSALYDDRTEERGVQGRAALNLVEERVAPFAKFRTSFFETTFETAGDEPGRSALTDALAWLVEAGELINAGKGRYFPAPTRIVRMPTGDALVLSGKATDELAATLGLTFSSNTILRCVDEGSPAGLTETHFADWSQTPRQGAVAWARAELSRPLPEMRTDASKWEFAVVDAPGYPWHPISEAENLERPLLVQYRNEGTGRQVRLLASLHRRAGSVECVRGRSISFHDCSRIIAGVRMAKGIPRRIFVRRKEDQIFATIRCYELPEVILAFTALCEHRQQEDAKILFQFRPATYEWVRTLAKFFGFELQENAP